MMFGFIPQIYKIFLPLPPKKFYNPSTKMFYINTSPSDPPAPDYPFIFWGFGFLALSTSFFWFRALSCFPLWLWLWWLGWWSLAWLLQSLAVGLVGWVALSFVLCVWGNVWG
jgi:hypothetical protein